MKKSYTLFYAILGCIVILASCAPQKYVHNNPAFSFEVVPGYKQEKAVGDYEIVRFANQNEWKIPVYAAAVFDKPSGLKLSNASKFIVSYMEKQNPGASRFKVLSEKTVTLGDGSDAQAIRLKWKWVDSVTLLKSVGVITFKEEKMIYLSGTTTYNGPTPYENLEKVCMTLQLE